MPQETKSRQATLLTVVQNKPVPAAKDEVFHREIIVSGDDALSKTIAEELRGAGARIIKVNNAADLLGAGVHRARAVVCAGPNDAVISKSHCWQGNTARRSAWWHV